MTSGTNSSSMMDKNSQDLEDQRRLIELLDRKTEIKALDSLVSALGNVKSNVELRETAIAFDANVFLRLGTHSKSADIIDYLSANEAPVVLPGQAIQEFWNNQFSAVETVSVSLKKKFDSLRSDVEKIEQGPSEFSARFGELLEDFESGYGHWYDETTVKKTVKVLEFLQDRARVPFASRLPFFTIAALRKKSKTPPGFKDEGDGDFFIWVDLLTGLLQARRDGEHFSRVVLVSNDQKIDWSRAGVAHPILAAEVHALLNVPFEIWNLDRLAKEVGST